MANRQRAEARRKAAAKASRQEGGSKVWLWSAVGAIVAIALIVVVVVMDFMAQLQAYLMSHQYESLLKKANFKGSGFPAR